MTSKALLDTLGEIDCKWVEDAVPRPNTARRRRMLYRVAGMAACLLLIVSIGSMTSLWTALFDPNAKPDVLPNDHPNVEGVIVMPVPWEDMIAGSVDKDTPDALFRWLDFEVSHDLYEALNRSENDDKYFALTISRKNNGQEEFYYAGMTVEDYQEFYKSIEERRDYLWNKLEPFEKAGLWLCWGEILYTTGIPEDIPYVGGDKWSEELYWSEVEFYGQEMIDTYTEGHTLLLDQLRAYGAALEAEIRADEALAEEWRQAYAKSGNYQLFEELVSKGYFVYHSNHTVYLFITKEQLKNIDIDHSSYSLNFAYRNPLEDEPDVEPDVPLPDVVE